MVQLVPNMLICRERTFGMLQEITALPVLRKIAWHGGLVFRATLRPERAVVSAVACRPIAGIYNRTAPGSYNVAIIIPINAPVAICEHFQRTGPFCGSLLLEGDSDWVSARLHLVLM